MLRFDAVGKVYRGIVRRTTALADFSLHVAPGEVVGLIGANGAGKTTAIQLALGFLQPTSGVIRVLGEPAGAASTRSRIAWVADEPIYPRRATAVGLVEEWLAGHGVRNPERRERAREILDRFGLAHAAERKISTYSLGMQQKVSLALALAHRPELMILDEPLSALDHRAVVQVRGILKDARRLGHAALISSHHLSELELVCDRVVFLAHGAVEREQRLDSDGGATFVHLQVGNVDQTRAVLETQCPAFFSQWSIDGHGLIGQVDHRDRIPDLVAFLASQQVRIESVSDRFARLEEAFLALQEGRR